MSVLRSVVGVATFLGRIAVFGVCLGLGTFRYQDPHRRRRLQITWSSHFNRWILGASGIRVSAKGLEHLSLDGRPTFIVSNHLADLDAMVLSSLYPSVFITSVEVGGNAFLGLLSRLGGSVFVERRRRFTLPQELNGIVNLLNQGFPVVLFPEGTSSNGEGVLPFKNALFRAAIAAEARVVPVCIQYLAIDGEPVTRSNRDNVFYYGDMGFFSHLVRLCRLRSVDVQVHILEAFSLRSTDDRKSVASRAYERIASHYSPVL